MEITWALPVFVVVLVASLFLGGRSSFRLLLFLLPFQSIAVLVVGGFGLQASYALLPLVIVFGLKRSQAVFDIHVLILIIAWLGIFLLAWLWYDIVGGHPKVIENPPSEIGQFLYWTAALGFFVASYAYGRAVTTKAIVREDMRWFLMGGAAITLMGVYQFATVISPLPFPDQLVYNNPSFALNAVGAMDAVIPRISSTFAEPSMFTIYSSALIAVAFEARWFKLMYGAFGTTVAAVSTTGFIGLAIIFTYIVYRIDNKLYALGLLPAAVLFVVFCFDIGTYIEVLETFTIGKLSTGSGQTRLQGLVGGLEAWWQYPVLGWGLGAGRTTDGLSYLLLNLGIIGGIALVWMLVIAFFRRNAFEGTHTRGLRVALFVLCVLHTLSVPDWHFPYIWVIAGYLAGTGRAKITV